MIDRGILFRVCFGVLLFVACLSLCPQSAALADISPDDLDSAPIAYQPKMLASLDDIAKALQTTRGSFAYWGFEDPSTNTVSRYNLLAGGRVAKMNLSRTHLEFWGVSDTNNTPRIEMSLDTADITAVEIYVDPELKGEPFPVAVKIVHKIGNFPAKFQWLRALNLNTAETITDAFATLAAVGAGKLTIVDRSTPVPFGISARDLNADEKAAATVDAGLYVGAVDADSPAAKLGVVEGDYLLEINGTKITDLEAAKTLLSKTAVTSVTVWRKGKALALDTLTKM
ncbi:MAG: PDZ domain-containing protein [Alphaproteobacteria bacterium]|nr:PDZ domain-containing protein [Alphaproteobacteria bacterium]